MRHHAIALRPSNHVSHRSNDRSLEYQRLSWVSRQSFTFVEKTRSSQHRSYAKQGKHLLGAFHEATLLSLPDTHHFSSSHPGGRHVNKSNASRVHGSGTATRGAGFGSEGGFGAENGLLSITVEVPSVARSSAVGKQFCALFRISLRPMPGLRRACFGEGSFGGGGGDGSFVECRGSTSIRSIAAVVASGIAGPALPVSAEFAGCGTPFGSIESWSTVSVLPAVCAAGDGVRCTDTFGARGAGLSMIASWRGADARVGFSSISGSAASALVASLFDIGALSIVCSSEAVASASLITSLRSSAFCWANLLIFANRSSSSSLCVFRFDAGALAFSAAIV